MKAGALDRRVTFQRAVTMTNEFNEPETTWSDVATVWSSKEDIRDSERVRAAQAGAAVTTRFQVRYSPALADLSATDRLICEARTYQITGVKEIGRRAGLEITANGEAP